MTTNFVKLFEAFHVLFACHEIDEGVSVLPCALRGTTFTARFRKTSRSRGKRKLHKSYNNMHIFTEIIFGP